MIHVWIAQRSPAWHELRSHSVGASESGILWGMQRAYQPSLYAFWHYKAEKIREPELDLGANPCVRLGMAFEPVIAQLAAADNEWEISPGPFVTDDTTPGLSASLDFVIAPSETMAAKGFLGPGALECKLVGWDVFKAEYTGDEPPFAVLLQLQHQLAATGWGWGAVAAVIGGVELRVWLYNARIRVIEEIRDRVRAFWKSIDDDVLPPVDSAQSTADAIRALYPGSVDDEADVLDDDIPILHQSAAGYVVETATERAAHERKMLHRNILAEAIGEHKRMFIKAVTPGDPAFSVRRAKNCAMTVVQLENLRHAA